MELWIRSQEKDKLVKVNNIEIQHHYTYKEVVENYMPPNATRYEDMQTRKVQKKDKYIKSIIMCNEEISVGTYKTEERALEVLDEIQRLITDLQYMSYAIPNNKFAGYRPNVYEMPKE